jgi:hypothetical protein
MDGKWTNGAMSMWRAQRREITAAFGGTSMLPTIGPGEEVRIQCGTPPKTGDVILFVRDGRPILHRVVAMTARDVWTRGDANILPDGPLPHGEVVGVAVTIERGGSSQPLVAAATRALPAIMLVISRAGGAGLVSSLWRIRSVAALLARKLLRPRRDDAHAGTTRGQ